MDGGIHTTHNLAEKGKKGSVGRGGGRRTRATGIAEEKPGGTLEIQGVLNRGEGE
jgi:hypothetical protein